VVAFSVALEEVAKQRAQRVRSHADGKQLALVLRLLGAASWVEGQQHFVKDVEVCTIEVPTGIEVTGMLLGGDAAPVNRAV